MSIADDVKRVYAEGLAAEPGTPNPYYGRQPLAVAWMAGYRKMLDTKAAETGGPRPTDTE
ncbi:hypothetical protein SEA_NAIRB_6 [Mycobacterium phage Nairb]|uniref:Uncharacterized protein n=5 Tax=Bernalvirus bernal13 TaxID=1982102 RepID=A0A2P1JRL9_9CAUD|nr:hypothetical protein FH37_gp06 [Mycobacterium phage Bernal13]AIT13419.1 helix-turn-helix DNA binding protein [Mycobacterium phage RonRayGun]ASJ79087.1 hypothetical protein SEA_ZENTIME222_6 [Mycobacterium phage ZenTime222]AVO21794.1 hypothetical protein SEA_NAIRB_6 [Mycobacterium phage Nairb]QBP28851.1 hypothetical protein SEA_IBRAHIM_6 [Mycobacterium phage Ibrahim]QHB47412.1 hypothetical protein SEA_WHITTY_6 [Mycobacterium phage Whitty]